MPREGTSYWTVTWPSGVGLDISIMLPWSRAAVTCGGRVRRSRARVVWGGQVRGSCGGVRWGSCEGHAGFV
eukprot:155276-Prymnesium_polylepis.1